MVKDKFYLTFYKPTGYYLDSRLKEFNSLEGFLYKYARKNDLGWIDVKEVDNHKGLQIGSPELSFIFVFLTTVGKDCGRDEYFVLGNSRYAISNNQKLKYYVPDFNRAFRTENDAVAELGWDAPFSSILRMQHCTFEQLWDLIEKDEIRPSRIWSPFDDPKFFDTDYAQTNQDRERRFQVLWSKRIEAKKLYVAELLDSIVNKTGSKSTCSSIICSGADGMSVIIDPSKIAGIVPESNPWDLIAAKIIIPNDNVIRVDLRSFVKELIGFELSDYQLPESMNEPSLDENTINFKEAWEAAEELTKRFSEYEIHKQQESDHSDTSDSGHIDPDIASDDNDEIFDPDATFDDDEDDVFHPEDDEEEGK